MRIASQVSGVGSQDIGEEKLLSLEPEARDSKPIFALDTNPRCASGLLQNLLAVCSRDVFPIA
jgi:hypothetical protein